MGEWLVVVGGQQALNSNNPDVSWRLHVPSGKWEPLPGGPSPRYGCSTVVTGCQMLLFGGEQSRDMAHPDASTPCTDVSWLLDIPSCSWTALEAGPSGRFNCRTVAVAGGIVVAGGSIDGEAVAADPFWRLDLASLAWELLELGPSPRLCFEVLALAGHVVVVGGMSADQQPNPDVAWRLSDNATRECRRAWQLMLTMEAQKRATPQTARMQKLCALPDGLVQQLLARTLKWRV